MFACPKFAIFPGSIPLFKIPVSRVILSFWLSSVSHGCYSSHGPICCPIIISCPITGRSGEWFDSKTRMTSGTTCLSSGSVGVELWQWFRHVWLNRRMFFWKNLSSVKDTRQESARSRVSLWSWWSLVMLWSTRSPWEINDMQNCPVQEQRALPFPHQSAVTDSGLTITPLSLRTGEYYLPSSSKQNLSQPTTLLL